MLAARSIRQSHKGFPMSIEPDERLGIRGQANAVVRALITSVVGVFALLVVVVLVSKALGLGEEDSESTAASTASSSAPTAPATTPAAAPVSLSDPRCAPAAENVVAQVQAGLTMDGYRLTNATVIIDGRLTFFGATTLDASGQMEERSDVWILRDHVVFASTGGARINSQFPKASSSPLSISPADERVRAVDACVVDATRRS
ncbi:hypothetical protein OIE68_31710 [Nocardia vinacea]|uniref:hypothetical protein n=1 Tax=Nocardia vinacea TaxID=96468 RepID=UPI002E14551C|nr:hypothetical protein OIE68_31710 [Nocardia vinacea]